MQKLFNLLKALYVALKGLPMAIVKNFLPAFRRILRFLCGRLRAFLRCLCHWIREFWCKSGPRHIASHDPVIPVNHPAYVKPDPLIYDQYYLMSLGLAVTWGQNPDIKIELGGVPVVSTYDLQPDTTYDLFATIWNGSNSGVISGMQVTFSYLSFGATIESNLIGITSVDLGAKCTKHCPVVAPKQPPPPQPPIGMKWKTPITPGHYCIQVSFAWIDDANPFNNLGQENTQVVQALSAAEFSFVVGNSNREEKVYRFEFDSYAIPELLPCSDTPPDRARGKRRKPGTVPPVIAARHLRANYPLPAGWTLTFDPANPVVPGETEIPINATVTPPDDFHGSLPLNIHTFSGNDLIGGVTIIVNRA
jgi:hypothetical protein